MFQDFDVLLIFLEDLSLDAPGDDVFMIIVHFGVSFGDLLVPLGLFVGSLWETFQNFGDLLGSRGSGGGGILDMDFGSVLFSDSGLLLKHIVQCCWCFNRTSRSHAKQALGTRSDSSDIGALLSENAFP